MCFSSCRDGWASKKKIVWVPMRNRTSDLWIPHSDALPQSHRDTETKCGRGPLRNSRMTSSSISLPSSKLIIFLILSTNITLSTSLILTIWMDVCHMRRVSCHITLVTTDEKHLSQKLNSFLKSVNRIMKNCSERLYCSFPWKTAGNHQSVTYLSY